MAPGRKIRVLVVEKEENLSHWLGRFLDYSRDYVCAGICRDPGKLAQTAREVRAEVILLDSHAAADLDRETLQELRREMPGLFIVLTDLEEGPNYERLARKIGADTFLSKVRVPEDLKRMKRQLAGAEGRDSG